MNAPHAVDKPSQLPLVGLHHIGRLTGKLEASIGFYRDVLGFQEVPRPNFNFPGAWLENYGLQIHLIVHGPAPAPGGPIEPRHNHLAFFVQDVADIEELLRQHAVEFRVNIQAGTGVKQLFFQDPDGNHIEVGTYQAGQASSFQP